MHVSQDLSNFLKILQEISPNEVDTTKRLEALRKLMKNQNYVGHFMLEAYIIPSEDAHMVSLPYICIILNFKKSFQI